MLGSQQLQLVWDAIALHTTASIALHKQPEVASCAAGIGIDIVGFGVAKIPPQQVAAINAAYPRLGIKEQFKDALIQVVRKKPQTTYDNFVKDFGERYVSGFRAPSGADRIQNAPYSSEFMGARSWCVRRFGRRGGRQFCASLRRRTHTAIRTSDEA